MISDAHGIITSCCEKLPKNVEIGEENRNQMKKSRNKMDRNLKFREAKKDENGALKIQTLIII